MTQKKDTIYTAPGDPLVQFTFDDRVAGVFRDMIERSVPGYSTTIAMIGALAARYAVPGTRCYDLGASLGAASLAMHHHIKTDNVTVIAVDNSPAMVRRGRLLTENAPQIEWREDDILTTHIENASVVVLNFTLQFIKPEKRRALIERIFQGINPGGVLILSEKIRFENQEEDRKQVDWHHTFKEANGYSRMEIAKKRTALENILIPETLTQHIARLKKAGFHPIYPWFQCFNFVSLIAEKAVE